MKYKIGDRVKIVSNQSNHHFEVGDVVIIMQVYREGTDQENYDASRTGKDFWLDWSGFSSKEVVPA